MKWRFLICSALICASGFFSLRAELDWPEFRGPAYQGHSTAQNIPLHWSATENVAWKAAIPGEGWSSPVYVDGRIYLTSAIGDPNSGISLRAFCLDARNGEILWNKEVFEPGARDLRRIHRKNSHASPTPLVNDGRIYVHFGYQGTACLNQDGEILWKTKELTYEPVHGAGGSPILAGDALIFSCDGARDPFLGALNKDTGKVLWKTPRNSTARQKFSFSTPLLIEINGVEQVISPASNLVAGYDPSTGNEIWRAEFDGYSVIPRPVFGHGLIFIGTGYDNPTVMAVRPTGSGDVTATHIEWVVKRSAPNTPSLLLVGEELYMVSDGGIATCLDARTGESHWQERVGGNFSASPIYADGRIYLQNEEGVGIVLAPGTEFKPLARNDLRERTLASYAVTEGALFIRTAEHLYCIGSTEGLAFGPASKK